MPAKDNISPEQLGRALDTVSEAHVTKQPANFAEPPWHLLKQFVPEDEMGGWMYMGEEPWGNPRYHSPSVPRTHHIFKHGISRSSVGVGVNDVGPVLTKDGFKEHYETLHSFGESPKRPYDDSYIAERSNALREAGWNTIIGKVE